MKTIKQWFETFEDAEIRKRALENMDKKDQNLTKNTIEDAILDGFNWYKSKEGVEFWDIIFSQIDPISVKFDEVKHLIK